MTIQVRDRVFETNSSSTHSLTIVPDEILRFGFSPQTLRGGVIPVIPKSYGWEWHRYYRPENKLAYLLTQANHGSFDVDAAPDLARRLRAKNDRIAFILDTVERATSCLVSIEAPAGTSRIEASVSDSYGVGLEVMHDPQALLGFLFSENSFVQTGNDNEGPGEFINTDYDEFETFDPRRYPTSEIGPEIVTMATDMHHDGISLSHPGREPIVWEEHGFVLENRIRYLLDGSTVVGGRLSGREFHVKNPRPRIALGRQEARDIVFRTLDHLGPDEENSTVGIFIAKEATFSGDRPDARTFDHDYAVSLDHAMTPDQLEAFWTAAQAIKALQSASPHP